jgi:hypothetical protein
VKEKGKEFSINGGVWRPGKAEPEYSYKKGEGMSI